VIRFNVFFIVGWSEGSPAITEQVNSITTCNKLNINANKYPIVLVKSKAQRNTGWLKRFPMK